MQDLKILIEKFWSGRMNDAELEDLDMCLKKQTDQRLDIYFEENEVEDDSEEYFLIGNAGKEQILKNIHDRIGAYIEEEATTDMITNSGKIIPIWRWIAGAAACIVVVFYLHTLINDGKNRKVSDNPIVTNKKTGPFVKTVDNNSDTVVNVVLPDGSISDVYPHSQINYQVPFEENKRDISLTGIAKFKVAKDPRRPFTVFSHGVATTALGTYFKLAGTLNGLEITLYEGKLKIHPMHDSSAAKNAYLVGGQKLCVDNHFGYRKSLITDIQQSRKLPAVIPVHQDNRVQDTFQLAYHNTPLSHVFRNMGIQYHKVFSYDHKAVLDSLPFTGRFNKGDSLDVLLKIICGMNNLRYEIQDNKVIIRSNQ